MCVCAYVYMYVYVCAYIYMYMPLSLLLKDRSNEEVLGSSSWGIFGFVGQGPGLGN